MPVINPGIRWIAGVSIIWLITACVTPQQTLQLIESPPDIPTFAELTSTPFYPQREYQCGPAALATVINFHRQQTSAEELIPLVYIPELKGSLQVEMLAATRRFDLLAIEQDGSLEAILREIANGNPVLVMQNLGLEIYPFWHYAVVVGYDFNKQEIILRSGEIKRLVRPFSAFERTWKRSNYWSVVIVPPDLMPVSVSQKNYTKAAVALESSTVPQVAMQAYSTALKRWPNSFILQMGLGNSAFALKNYLLAENAFLKATIIQPETADAWNNLAYALIKQGKRIRAMKAINMALKLEPTNTEFIDSKQELNDYALKVHRLL